MKNKNYLWIGLCALAILLIYTLDLYQLNYRLKSWREFGESPVAPAHIQYFIANTPNVISYKEVETGELVSCSTAVAFVETESQESYRCCTTSNSISCLAGNYTNDIPEPDEKCTTGLMELFGVPASLAGTREYITYGVCPVGGYAELTVVQLDNNGRILWKFVETNTVQTASTTLRCFLGPILLLVILRIVMVINQAKRNQPIPKLWKSDNKG